MKPSKHLWAWVNHAALNAGSALQCVYHVVVPPQMDHEPQVVRSLAKSNPAKEFLIGMGAMPRMDR